MAVTFKIVDGYHTISGVEQRNLDAVSVATEVVDNREWTWDTQAEGSLQLTTSLLPLTTYKAAPIERDKLTREGQLVVGRLRIRSGDPDRSLAQALGGDPDLIQGATVIVRRYYANLDRASITSYRQLFHGQVTNFSFDEAGNLSLEVSDRWFDWAGSVNRRTYTKRCGWVFKGAQCGYTGPETWCDKSKTTCEALGNEARFGGFEDTAGLQFTGLRFV